MSDGVTTGSPIAEPACMLPAGSVPEAPLTTEGPADLPHKAGEHDRQHKKNKHKSAKSKSKSKHHKRSRSLSQAEPEDGRNRSHNRGLRKNHSRSRERVKHNRHASRSPSSGKEQHAKWSYSRDKVKQHSHNSPSRATQQQQHTRSLSRSPFRRGSRDISRDEYLVPSKQPESPLASTLPLPPPPLPLPPPPPLPQPTPLRPSSPRSVQQGPGVENARPTCDASLPQLQSNRCGRSREESPLRRGRSPAARHARSPSPGRRGGPQTWEQRNQQRPRSRSRSRPRSAQGQGRRPRSRSRDGRGQYYSQRRPASRPRSPHQPRLSSPGSPRPVQRPFQRSYSPDHGRSGNHAAPVPQANNGHAARIVLAIPSSEPPPHATPVPPPSACGPKLSFADDMEGEEEAAPVPLAKGLTGPATTGSDKRFSKSAIVTPPSSQPQVMRLVVPGADATGHKAMATARPVRAQSGDQTSDKPGPASALAAAEEVPNVRGIPPPPGTGQAVNINQAPDNPTTFTNSTKESGAGVSSSSSGLSSSEADDVGGGGGPEAERASDATWLSKQEQGWAGQSGGRARMGRVLFGSAQARCARPYMEDRTCVVATWRPTGGPGGRIIDDGIERSYLGMFDGHNGSRSAEVATERLHSMLSADPAFRAHTGEATSLAAMAAEEAAVGAALKRAFRTLDDDILQQSLEDGGRDGATALVLLRLGDTFYTAHAGDSRAVLCRAGGRAHALTLDHKPDNPEERARVEANGGRVDFQRCWRVVIEATSTRPGSGLAVSRSLGDMDFKQPKRLVECLPDVGRIVPRPGDSFVVLATDGLWDVVSNQDAVDCVNTALQGCRGQPSTADVTAAAEATLALAVKRGTCDNCSVVVMAILWPTETQ